MRSILLLLLVIIAAPSLAQQSSRVASVSGIGMEDISDEGYYYQRLPMLGKGTVQITNLQYEPITKTEKAVAAVDSIKVGYGIEAKKPVAMIQVPGIISDAGQLKKITSYRLVIEEQPQPVHTMGVAYPANSVLSSGTFAKIAVSRRGVYKIDADMLVAMGFTPSSVHPANIRIYGNGGQTMREMPDDSEPVDLVENSIYVSSTGTTFGPNDYILFYAPGVTRWDYDPAQSKFTHTQNYYEDSAFYFVNVDKGPGKRIATVTANEAPDIILTSFDDYATYDVDSIPSPHGLGKVWWSHPMHSQSAASLTQNVSLSLSNPVGPIRVDYHFGSTVASSGSQMQLLLNGGFLSNSALGGLATYVNMAEVYGTANANTSSALLNFQLKFTPSSFGIGLLDYIEVNGKSHLSLGTQHQLSFRSLESLAASSSGYVGYKVAGAAAATVWNVSDKLNPQILSGTNSGGAKTVSLPGGALHELIAFDGSSFLRPRYVGMVENQNLMASGFADLLIITRADFGEVANKIADFHRNRDGITVNVATVDKIYNEFGSGGQDIAAIRNYIRMFYDRAATAAELPKNVLLLGASSFDYKDRIADNYNNIVPSFATYESASGTVGYSSDDYYTLLDSGEVLGSGAPLDIGIGRIPANTVAEAEDFLKKLEQYVSPASFGSWKNTFTFVSDDIDAGAISQSHTHDAEELVTSLSSAGDIYNKIKLYGDSYPLVATASGNKLPALSKALKDQIFLGTFLVSYSGHGAPTRWSEQDILTVNDLNNWNNLKKLPVVLTATCDFGRYDDTAKSAERSGGVLMLLKPDGGSIATITTTQLVYAFQNTLLCKKYIEQQFARNADGSVTSMGEAMRQAKNQANGSIGNNNKFVILGDPALRLALPKFEVHTDSITVLTSETNSRIADTINALGIYKLHGSIRDVAGNVRVGFSGKAYVTIYDKVQTIPFNKQMAPSGFTSFQSRTNTIFKGIATVNDGKFSIEFVAPKDMNYDFGKGKISYYAQSADMDASGVDTNTYVGGFAEYTRTDDTPPLVEAFIDNELFKDGDITGPDPLLFVKIYDDNGLNVSGSSVGHDLVAVLDGDDSKPFVLNNYYTSSDTDFRRGTVSFPMEGLSIGEHTLTVTAWDVYNNYGSGSVRFRVVGKDQGAIGNVYNFPNPFSIATTFSIQHNLGNQELETTIHIFDPTGRWVNTIVHTGYAAGTNLRILWDGRSRDGLPLNNGVYVYKIQIRTKDGGISATGYNKMVLLR